MIEDDGLCECPSCNATEKDIHPDSDPEEREKESQDEDES